MYWKETLLAGSATVAAWETSSVQIKYLYSQPIRRKPIKPPDVLLSSVLEAQNRFIRALAPKKHCEWFGDVFFFFILPLPLLVCSVCSVGIVPVKYCVKSKHKGHHYVWRLVLPFTYCALHLVNTCLLALRRMCVRVSLVQSARTMAWPFLSLFSLVCVPQ